MSFADKFRNKAQELRGRIKRNTGEVIGDNRVSDGAGCGKESQPSAASFDSSSRSAAEADAPASTSLRIEASCRRSSALKAFTSSRIFSSV